MICPSCQQRVDPAVGDGACPYCRYPCRQFHLQVTMTQVVIWAIFALTLVYGALVAVLELAVGYRPAGGTAASNLFGGLLLVPLLGIVIFFKRAQAKAVSASEPSAMRSALTVAAALAEAPAIYGLLMYLVSGSIMWFTIFLGVSWLLFLDLGLRLPEYLNRMKDAIGR